MWESYLFKKKKALWSVHIIKSNHRNIEIETYSTDALLMPYIIEIVANKTY